MTSGTFGKINAMKHKGGGVTAVWKQFSAAGSSLSPRFDKAKGATGSSFPLSFASSAMKKAHGE